MAKREIFDQIVRYFVNDYGGFLIVSDDATFVRMFKGLLRALGISQNSLHCEFRNDHYVQQVRKMLKRFKRVVLFVEASLDGNNTTIHFRQIKELLGDQVVIICLSNEMNRDILCLFHEMGADNIIVKPVSINSIVEKIAFTIKPNNLRTLVSKAKKSIVAKDYSAAESIIDEILSINPDSAIAHILMGDIYRQKKKFDAAEESYKKASSRARMYLEPLERLVGLYEDTGDDSSKTNILKKLDKLSPLNHKRKIELGDIHVKLGQTEGAMQYYGEAVAVVRKYAKEQVVTSLMQVGKRIISLKPRQGLAYMVEAMEMKSGDFSGADLWMFNEIGLQLRKQGQWSKAISYYTNALGLDPRNAGLLYNIGMAYLQGKQYRKAKQYVEQALIINAALLQGDASIPYSAALISYHAHAYADAHRYVTVALKNDPEHVPSLKLQKMLKNT